MPDYRELPSSNMQPVPKICETTVKEHLTCCWREQQSQRNELDFLVTLPVSSFGIDDNLGRTPKPPQDTNAYKPKWFNSRNVHLDFLGLHSS